MTEFMSKEEPEHTHESLAQPGALGLVLAQPYLLILVILFEGSTAPDCGGQGGAGVMWEDTESRIELPAWVSREAVLPYCSVGKMYETQPAIGEPSGPEIKRV